MAFSPRIGSRTAEEIYLAVGMALSWWESSEDMLLGLFRSLNDNNPDRVAIYIKATRNVRAQMMDKDLGLRPDLLNAYEKSKIQDSINHLKDMVATRNQIGHGFCSHLNISSNNTTTMSGYFLIPAYNEHGPSDRAREMRFALSGKDIHSFIKLIRIHRGVVMDAHFAIMQRAQDIRLAAEGQAPIQSQNSDKIWDSF